MSCDMKLVCGHDVELLLLKGAIEVVFSWRMGGFILNLNVILKKRVNGGRSLI